MYLERFARRTSTCYLFTMSSIRGEFESHGPAWDAFQETFDVRLDRVELVFSGFVLAPLPPELGSHISGRFRRAVWDASHTTIEDVAEQDVPVLYLPRDTASDVYPLGYGDVRIVVERPVLLRRLRRLGVALSTEAHRRYAGWAQREVPTPGDLLALNDRPVAGDLHVASSTAGAVNIGRERATFLVDVLRLAGALDEYTPVDRSGTAKSPNAALVAAYKLTDGGRLDATECQNIACALDEIVSTTRNRLQPDDHEHSLLEFLSDVARLSVTASTATGLSVQARL